MGSVDVIIEEKKDDSVDRQRVGLSNPIFPIFTLKFPGMSLPASRFRLFERIPL